MLNILQLKCVQESQQRTSEHDRIDFYSNLKKISNDSLDYITLAT